MHKLYVAGHKDIIATAKTFERRLCNHAIDQPLSVQECLTSVIDSKMSGTNKHRYLVAANDENLRSSLRSMPAVPLIYVKRGVIIMEPMVNSTQLLLQKVEKDKMRAGLLTGSRRKRKREDGEDHGNESSSVPGLGKEATTEPLDTLPVAKELISRRRKKGPKQPNPLSMKKSKVKSSQISLKRQQDEPKTVDVAAVPEERPGLETAHTPVRRKRRRRHKVTSNGEVGANQIEPSEE